MNEIESKQHIINAIKYDGCIHTDRRDKNNQIIIDALEKQIPKKPTRYDWYPYSTVEHFTWFCPICNSSYTDVYGKQHNYCAICGQKIDWSKEVTE